MKNLLKKTVMKNYRSIILNFDSPMRIYTAYLQPRLSITPLQLFSLLWFSIESYLY